MTVKELREALNKFPDSMEVILEVPINNVEFNAPVERIYESEKLYIRGEKSNFSIEDAEKWWGTMWIPVSESERPPEKGKEVLVSTDDTYEKVIIARYQGEQYGFTCGLVSAWMPLPKQYKAERENKR